MTECREQQRAYPHWAVLSAAQKPRLVFAKALCVHHNVVHFPESFSILFFPLHTNKILILEDVLVVFCGQFGGGEMSVG